MKLAKFHLDVGLFTNQRDAQLEFWQNEIGLAFDHLGKLGRGVHQLRHHMNGSILKINHARDPLPTGAPAAGWTELLIADARRTTPRALSDPDGNRVQLVPPGHEGVVGIGLRVEASDPPSSRRFYERVFAATRIDDQRCKIGDSVLIFYPCASTPRPRPVYQARGFRYVTVQIFDCDREHARMLELGGEEGRAPRTIGNTTRYSFVLDPDGNWIEVSQRGELTGGLSSELD